MRFRQPRRGNPLNLQKCLTRVRKSSWKTLFAWKKLRLLKTVFWKNRVHFWQFCWPTSYKHSCLSKKTLFHREVLLDKNISVLATLLKQFTKSQKFCRQESRSICTKNCFSRKSIYLSSKISSQHLKSSFDSPTKKFLPIFEWISLEVRNNLWKKALQKITKVFLRKHPLDR